MNRAKKSIPVSYKGIQLDCGYRLDLLVENRLILEKESVDKLSPFHETQTLTYLR
ncbi:GxxExxY protein [bacterium]|nr:GxxExxY protein [bacterium]